MKKSLAAIALGIALTLGLLGVMPAPAHAAASCTIIYLPGEGTGSPVTQTYTCGSKVTLKSSASFTRAYHILSGWKVGSKTYSLGQTTTFWFSLSPQGSVTLKLTATWGRTHYPVKYDANGGKSLGSVPSIAVVKVNDIHTVVKATPTPKNEHFAFAYWSPNKSGTGAKYTAGNKILIGKAWKLYARWKQLDWTVTYKKGTTSTVTMPTVKAAEKWTSGSKYTIIGSKTERIPVRTHYRFTGWKSSANNKVYYGGTELTGLSSNLTLTAQWVQSEFKVSYDKNNGTGSVPKAVWKASGSKVTVTDKKLTRKGYDFLGWNTKANGKGTHYAAGAQITVKGTIKLYAEWWAQNQTPKPTISGTVKVGNTLTAKTGTWYLNNEKVTDFKYQWYADGKAIDGATNATLTLRADATSSATKKSTANHYDKKISVKVTGTAGTKSASKTSAKTAKVGKGTLTAEIVKSGQESPTGGENDISVWQYQTNGTWSTPYIYAVARAICKGVCNPTLSVTWEKRAAGATSWTKMKYIVEDAWTGPHRTSEGLTDQEGGNKTGFNYDPAGETFKTGQVNRSTEFRFTVTFSGYGYNSSKLQVTRTCNDTAPYCQA
jgi:hypothetical protein